MSKEDRKYNVKRVIRRQKIQCQKGNQKTENTMSKG